MFRQVLRGGATAPAVRSLSTSSAVRELARAPIQVHGTEGRYAHALYSAATKSKALDVVEKQLLEVKARAGSDAAFKSFLNNPVLGRKEKSDGIQAIMKNKKYNAITTNFFASLAENNRLGKATEVIDAFSTIMSAHRGEVLCKITSAEELNTATANKLNEALKGFVKKGQTLNVTKAIDPSIRGGIVVDIGDKHIDMSIATKVKKYSQVMRESL